MRIHGVEGKGQIPGFKGIQGDRFRTAPENQTHGTFSVFQHGFQRRPFLGKTAEVRAACAVLHIDVYFDRVRAGIKGCLAQRGIIAGEAHDENQLFGFKQLQIIVHDWCTSRSCFCLLRRTGSVQEETEMPDQAAGSIFLEVSLPNINLYGEV